MQDRRPRSTSSWCCACVEQVPRGRVTTYGAIAEVVGEVAGGGGPRQVGSIMASYGGPGARGGGWSAPTGRCRRATRARPGRPTSRRARRCARRATSTSARRSGGRPSARAAELGQPGQGLREDLRRRRDQPGADLADAGDAAGHAGVDLRQDAGPADPGDVDARWARPGSPGPAPTSGGSRPSVISCIRRVVASASGTVPPTKRTIAGAVAIAKPPMPAVSVIAESPMSGLASSGP